MPYKRKTKQKEPMPCSHCGKPVKLTRYQWSAKKAWCPDNDECQDAGEKYRKAQNAIASKNWRHRHGNPDPHIGKDEVVAGEIVSARTCRWEGCSAPVCINGLIEHRHCKHHLDLINQRSARMDPDYLYHTPGTSDDLVGLLKEITYGHITDMVYGG